MENTESLLKMNNKYNKTLPAELKEKINTLFDEGSKFQMGHKNLKAVNGYMKAYELLPAPKDQWSYALSLIRNIAENYFLKAFFDSKSVEESKKYYHLTLKYFERYMEYKGNIGHAYNHGRIGQIWFELGEFENAKEELLRAYMDSGMEWFEKLDPKYYELIKPIVAK